MSEIDLDKLERVALAATPGPWEWAINDTPRQSGDDLSALRTVSHHIEGANGMLPEWVIWEASFGVDNADANAEFISTFSPGMLIMLISRLRKAEKDSARIDWLSLNLERMEFIDGSPNLNKEHLREVIDDAMQAKS